MIDIVLQVGDLAVSVKELEGMLGIPLSGFVPGPDSAPWATKLPMDRLTQYLRKALHLSDEGTSIHFFKEKKTLHTTLASITVV